MTLPPPPSGRKTDPMIALAATADAFNQIIELAAGHRAKAIEAGFPEQAATIMAMTLHHHIVTNLTETAKP